MDEMLCGATGWRGLDLIMMWSGMTLAMMLPCAGAELFGLWRSRAARVPHAALFGLGYLGVMILPAAGAAVAERQLEAAGLMRGGALADPALGAALFLAGGVVAALALMRRPVHAEAARHGALRRGVAHGVSSLDLCAAMICVQLASGAMSIAWFAVLTIGMSAASLLRSLEAAR